MPIRSFFAENPRPLLIGAQVYLRPPARHDFTAWSALRAASRDFLKPWEPEWGAEALSLRTYCDRLRQWQSDARASRGQVLFIFSRSDDVLLGGISLSHIRLGAAQSANLGYWIGVAFAGKGYMGDALRTLIDHAFGTLRLHRLEAACLPENRPSQHLLEKNGFVREGMARGLIKINGAWRDHVVFARLAGDGAFRQQIKA